MSEIGILSKWQNGSNSFGAEATLGLFCCPSEVLVTRAGLRPN